MSLELLEKFLIELTPPAAHNPLHKVFKDTKTDPIACMVQGFQFLFDDIHREGSVESAAAVNGVILGIVLHYGIQRSPRMEQILIEYIEHHKKSKGDNVVDFTTARIGAKK